MTLINILTNVLVLVVLFITIIKYEKRINEIQESFARKSSECMQLNNKILMEYSDMREEVRRKLEVYDELLDSIKRDNEKYNETYNENIQNLSTENKNLFDLNKRMVDKMIKKSSLLEKNMALIEELFRFQLVNDLLDDVEKSKKLFENEMGDLSKNGNHKRSKSTTG